jgi:hypothetical protein
VFDVVSGMRWVSDIRGALTVAVLAEFLGVWDMFSQLAVQLLALLYLWKIFSKICL